MSNKEKTQKTITRSASWRFLALKNWPNYYVNSSWIQFTFHSSTAVVCIFVRLGNLASQYFLKYFTVHHSSSDSNNAIHFETPQHILLYYQRAYVPNCSLYHQLPAPRCIICSLRLHQIQFSDLPQIINALSVLLRQLVSCPVLYTVLLYKTHLRTLFFMFG